MMLLTGACEYDRRMLKIDKDWKNAMTSSIVTFSVKRNCCGKLNIESQRECPKYDSEEIAKQHFQEMKKSITVKNPHAGAHFTLKISTNQRFGTYAGGTKSCLT